MGKIGLVFAGGGGKGAYQIGVWKALKELKLSKQISALAGTSIGALNSVLFMQGDYEVAEDIWINISQERMLPVDKKIILRNMICVELSKKKMENIIQWADKLEEYGTVSRDGLLNIIDNNVDYKKISSSLISSYVTCTEVPCLEAKYFKINDYKEEKIRDILLATSAIPLVFDKVLIEDKYYVDGGLKDNVPITPLYDEGITTIIVVYFNRKGRIDKSLYPKANIIEILPSKDQGGWISGTLDFSSYGSIERIIEGYKDTMRIFEGVLEDYKECYDMEQYLNDRMNLINDNLNNMLEKRDSVEDKIKKIKHMKIINDSLKRVGKLRKNNSLTE